MAKKKKKEEALISNIKKSDVQHLVDRINKNDRFTSSTLYGVDQDTVDTNRADFLEIKTSLKKANDRFKEVSGDNTLEFLTKVALEDQKGSKRDIAKVKGNGNVLLNLNEMIDQATTGQIKKIYSDERGRLLGYREYEMITKLIPQVSQIIDVIADNIISPDDFTKDVFQVFFAGKDKADLENEKEVLNNLRKLERIYKIEPKIKRIIKDTLVKGDNFVAVLPLKREFNRMSFNENGQIQSNTIFNNLSESSVMLSEQEKITLDKMFQSDKKEKISWEKELTETVNRNIEISDNPLCLIQEEISMRNEMINESVAPKDNVGGNDLNMNPLLLDLNKGKKKKDIVNVEGSYVKILEPDKVIKLQLGSTCFGYYYIDTPVENYIEDMNATSRFNDLRLSGQPDLQNADSELVNPKSKFISELFTKMISKKLNKKFIENNSAFKNVIYELVREDYITKKKIKLVYLSPDEVVHFKVNEKEDGYGDSELEPVMFTAKLYLACLTTSLMLKMTRSADRRTFYIETGLSKDVENTVQAFIRDIKTKEMKFSDLNSVDTIFNTVGAFQDYFIPQFDGTKPVDIETTPGQDVTLESDLLEYLRKALISGMGVPSTFLQYADEVEFSRSLAMQNGRFLRSIVTKQKALGEGFTQLYRLLYINEFINVDIEKDGQDLVDVRDIEVKFPSPASLNMTNMNDQIGSVGGIVDFIIQTKYGNSNPNEKEMDLARRVITQRYLPSIEWVAIDEAIEEAKNNELKNRLIQDVEEENNEGEY